MPSTVHGQGRARAVIAWLLLAPTVACGAALRMPAGNGACQAALRSLPLVTAGVERLRGIDSVSWTIRATAGHTYLVEAYLDGNDALLEVVDARRAVVARADHPERRTGTRRLVLAAPEDATLTARVTGKEHAAVVGAVSLLVVDLAGLSAHVACRDALELLAAADSDYAAGQEISRGRGGSHPASGRHSFLRAAEGYRAAQAALSAAGDAALAGEGALAVAGVEYFDLQNWALGADWAKRASDGLKPSDPYRQARADAILAAAWIELATEASPGRPIPGVGLDSAQLLKEAEETLGRLIRFHAGRGERYDSALQVNNVGLAEIYAGRFSECASTFRSAERMFAALAEGPRRALAAQNRGMCLWGLGQLRDALRALEVALVGLRPDPYPSLYLITLNNAALLHYALGEYDTSLRLSGQALELAVRVQSKREEAQSLFGIGTTYYAIGDIPRARDFLERSLAIRSVAFDGRGRMASLRVLATMDGDEGRLADALARDGEALALATVPAAAASIRLQTARHLALGGDRREALRLIDAEVAAGSDADPLIVGRARLERAMLRRTGGNPAGALSDLAAAQPLLRDWGTVTDSFAVDLELARVQRERGATPEALSAVDHALAGASAIRVQSANPELRTRLQAPLRDAYALKIDVLWDQYAAASKDGQAVRATSLAADSFEVADASRAQTFADIAAAQYPATLRRALAAEFARREALYREIAERRFTLETHQDAVGSTDDRAKELRADIAGLERTLDAVNTAIASPETSRTNPARSIRRMTETASLTRDAALISYWLGPSAAYAWVVSGTAVHWVRLGSSADIATSARAFYDALSRTVDVPMAQRLAAGADLYDRVLRPLEPWLHASRDWVVIPDAALNYAPFTALRGRDGSGEYFVVARHNVAIVPAAWMLRRERPGRNQRSPRRLLLVANPVYERSDARLPAGTDVGAGPEVRSLPFTAKEAAAVSELFAGEAVDRLEGPAASRERLLALDWSRYRYIHLATHAIADATHPQFSSLLLSRYDASGRPIESAVRVADLELLALDADVVVFSGCETAFGKEVPSEGLLGLGYATLARGGRAVVASLWSVADEMTADLMTEFYRRLIGRSMPPMSAMSAAMRAVLARNPGADPALWAPFQVSVVTLPPGHDSGPAGLAGRSTTN